MKKLITLNVKTREQIANPFYEIPHQELVNHANAIDLRNNSKTILLENGYIQIEPIDESIRFSCPNCTDEKPCEMSERIKVISDEFATKLEKLKKL